ncbi:hypothetical protein [Streptomyces canus]|uniref:hypothetical protein n=1 Tax=Streptomyces canus TaxID=58343 RepID=UPI00370FF34B
MTGRRSRQCGVMAGGAMSYGVAPPAVEELLARVAEERLGPVADEHAEAGASTNDHDVRAASSNLRDLSSVSH